MLGDLQYIEMRHKHASGRARTRASSRYRGRTCMTTRAVRRRREVMLLGYVGVGKKESGRGATTVQNGWRHARRGGRSACELG